MQNPVTVDPPVSAVATVVDELKARWPDRVSVATAPRSAAITPRISLGIGRSRRMRCSLPAAPWRYGTWRGVVPTLTFDLLFAFLVLGHGRRQLLWFEVTRHPTAEWLVRQIAFLIRHLAEPDHMREILDTPKRRGMAAVQIAN